MRSLLLLAALALPVLAACERPQPARRDSVSMTPASPTRETAQLAGRPARDGASPATPAVPSAVTAASGARPAMPMVIERFCQGESCSVEYPALACATVELRAAAADTAAVVARVARGDTVQVRTRNLHVLEPGRIVVRKSFALTSDVDAEGERSAREDTLDFTAGDTVYLLHYHELGWWAWWHRGRTASGSEFWAGPEDGDLGGAIFSDDSSLAVGLSQPRTADWWHVEPRSGRAGWWRADTLHSLMSIPRMQKWNDECPTR